MPSVREEGRTAAYGVFLSGERAGVFCESGNFVSPIFYDGKDLDQQKTVKTGFTPVFTVFL